ncbi:MAG: hypothetical protein C4533_03305 [Candidatus Omnitrophota bacterium]|jgi:TonB family protein|nr:MAG: hypothetical protein C4533_03305 [Candidatus Omnitrophota bacterium]
MRLDKFQIALLISLFLHSAIFIQANFFHNNPAKIKEKEVEINYLKEIKQVKEKQLFKSELLEMKAPKAAPDSSLLKPIIEKDKFIPGNKTPGLTEPVFKKPTYAKPDIISVKKKISLPPIDLNKIDNPSYISYYQIVRERIKRAAYQNYNGQETGETQITFIIDADGTLRDARLIQEKSSASQYLKKITLDSIDEASPFPPFPKELDYPQLSFNVVISFEVE